MNSRSLLDQLGDLARQEQDRQLRSAQGQGSPADAEAALLRELYRRIEPKSVARIADRCIRAFTASRNRTGTVLPWPGVLRILAPLAAAALLVLGINAFRPAEFPSYALELSGGTAQTRGEPVLPQQPLVLAPGSKVEVVLRPENPTSNEIAAAFFLVDGARVVPCPSPVEVSSSGAVRAVVAVPHNEKLANGTWKLVALVGPKGEVPSEPGELARLLQQGATTRVKLQSAPVLLQGFRGPPSSPTAPTPGTHSNRAPALSPAASLVP